MSEANGFQPKIIAFVCNWCTYLGADLAGTARLEYPANVRIVRLPCTGRIDFNLIVKAFEMGADAVLVSGCHPGDCHYTAGNYHARRRWVLFRALLDAMGFDLRRIHFSWISAAEGRKFQEVVTDITRQTQELGPYTGLYSTNGSWPAAHPAAPDPVIGSTAPLAGQVQLREHCRWLLADGTVNVVIGYGQNGPVFVHRPEQADRLVWNLHCLSNLTAYLKRKEVRALGRPAIVVKGCDERALVVLEKENQIDRKGLYVIGMPCEGMGRPKCETCKVRQPRFADHVIVLPDSRAQTPHPQRPPVPPRVSLKTLMEKTPAERMAYWAGEFERCVKCFACRQVCPLCYCERCIADKNRPVVIDTSASAKGNFAWHITRAFHLAGRCIGCGECTRACPAGIDLSALNLALAKAANDHFGYQAGMDPNAEPLIGSYSLDDKENFIR